MSGVSDLPLKKLEQDTFGLQKNVEGLADYILNCETPTTISVQGDRAAVRPVCSIWSENGWAKRCLQKETDRIIQNRRTIQLLRH